MPPFTHLLDTSAILAHYFDEPGAEQVDDLWRERGNRLAICVLTIPELKTRLHQELDVESEAESAFDLYVNRLTVSLAIDTSVAHEAARLREFTPARLPLIDACIAACASVHGCVLVHRDPHMDPLHAGGLQMLRLADKG